MLKRRVGLVRSGTGSSGGSCCLVGERCDLAGGEFSAAGEGCFSVGGGYSSGSDGPNVKRTSYEPIQTKTFFHYIESQESYL